MLNLKVEPLTPALIDEMKVLQDGYWQEVAGPFHHYPPDVDWATYLKAQEIGRLIVITGRADGALKGGCCVVLGPHPHYACISGSLPLLFIHPDCRRGREGVRLLKTAEAEAEKAGCQLLMTHGGIHNGVYRLFEATGYSDFGRYFVKQLPNGPNGNSPVFKTRV